MPSFNLALKERLLSSSACIITHCNFFITSSLFSFDTLSSKNFTNSKNLCRFSMIPLIRPYVSPSLPNPPLRLSISDLSIPFLSLRKFRYVLKFLMGFIPVES